MKKEKVVKRVSREIMGKRAAKHQEQTYWGDEPLWNPLLTEAETLFELGHALNWYNAMTDPDKQKEFLLKYVREHLSLFPDENDLIERLEKADDRLFPTYGSICRCISRGAFFPEKIINQLTEKIKEIAKEVIKPPAIVSTLMVPKVRHFKVQEGIVLGIEMLDDHAIGSKAHFPQASLADAVLEVGLTDRQRIEVQEYFEPFITELAQVLIAVDTVKEQRTQEQRDFLTAYKGYTKQTLERIIHWIKADPTEEVLAQAPTAERKLRKKKPMTTERTLKHFVYMEKYQDDQIELTSIDPERLLGAAVLWTYNVEKRRISVFRAKEGGLTVLRRSISNYDEETSITKTVRKPDEVLPKFLNSGKVELRKFMNNIRASEKPVNHRINEQTILLKVQ